MNEIPRQCMRSGSDGEVSLQGLDRLATIRHEQKGSCHQPSGRRTHCRYPAWKVTAKPCHFHPMGPFSHLGRSWKGPRSDTWTYFDCTYFIYSNSISYLRSTSLITIERRAFRNDIDVPHILQTPPQVRSPSLHLVPLDDTV